MAYAMHHHQHHHQFYSSSHHYPPQTDLAPQAETSKAAAPTETTPFKFDPENSNSMSPYWSHLDQATLAMGLATPAEVTPSTPMRRRQIVSGNKSLDQQDGGDDDEYPSFHAQAPLLRQQYYGFDAVPPSPATQFMMSPQASFAYNYGYGFSPTRMQRRASRHNYKTSTTTTPLKPVERRSLSPTHTIETATESESLEHPPTVATAI